MIRSPNCLKIDIPALVHNLNQVRELLGEGTGIIGIVKSDAYGHGLIHVSKALEGNGVDRLGVAHVHEALELRKKGIKLPILILCGIQTREEARAVVEKGLTPVIFDLGSVRTLAEECLRTGKRIPVHVKVDTGMGRLGISHLEVAGFIEKMMEYKTLQLEGLTSHLSSADEPEEAFTRAQISHFRNAIEAGRAMGLDLPWNHLANSAGIMSHRESHFNMARAGIMLYGGCPCPGFITPLPLMPVMSFSGRVIQVRDFPAHTPVSYSRTYYTKVPQKVAVVSAGYGDGLPRSLSNRGRILIQGQKARIVGRVCMNMTMCDITGMKDVCPGDEAVFLGRQDSEFITVDDMARWADTISYEVLCSLGSRHKREYTE